MKAKTTPSENVPQETRTIGEEIDRLTFAAGRAEPRTAIPVRVGPLAFKRILVAVDASPASDAATAWATHIAQTFGAKAWAVNVVAPPHLTEHRVPRRRGPHIAPSWYRSREEKARMALDVAEDRFRRAGLGVTTTMSYGNPAESIARLAREVKADLIVMGAHGHGRLGRALLGSVADAVTDRASCSVLLARNRPPADRILLATDGSTSSKRAAAIGYRLARAWRRHATVLHVLPSRELGEEGEGVRRSVQIITAFSKSRKDPHLHLHLDAGLPRARILREAEAEDAGLIVMGSRGLSGWRRTILGSVSRAVTHEARASVLVVKEAA